MASEHLQISESGPQTSVKALLAVAFGVLTMILALQPRGLQPGPGSPFVVLMIACPVLSLILSIWTIRAIHMSHGRLTGAGLALLGSILAVGSFFCGGLMVGSR